MIKIKCCDNLELISKIESKTVDLIYCDILYGTGRNFMDYKDLYPIREIIEEHYMPRLKEMHRILKDTGSIYLQMDYRINHWVRLIMDDIFGYGNFENEIIWCYKSGGSSNKKWSKKHDTILFYSKCTSKKKFNIQFEKSYMVVGSGENPAQKYYKDKNGNYTIVKCKDYWVGIGMLATSSKERVGYDTQKPKSLIERIIKASSNEGDLVADFYLGSGTTAEVCFDLDRNFVGCDINQRAVYIAKERCVKAARLRFS